MEINKRNGQNPLNNRRDKGKRRPIQINRQHAQNLKSQRIRRVNIFL